MIASQDDGAVPFAQAETLAANIQGAQLIASTAPSHFLWYATGCEAIAARIGNFLTAGHP